MGGGGPFGDCVEFHVLVLLVVKCFLDFCFGCGVDC